MFKVLSCAAFMCVFGGLQGQPVYLEITNQSANPVKVMVSGAINIEIDVKKPQTTVRTMPFKMETSLDPSLSSNYSLGSAKYLETMPAGGNLLMTLDLTGTNVDKGDKTEVLKFINDKDDIVGEIGLECYQAGTEDDVGFNIYSRNLTKGKPKPVSCGIPDPTFVIENEKP